MSSHADTIDTTGQAPYEQCGYCHEYDGNSKMPIYPRLAGQTQQYLAKQLRDFRSGKRQGTMQATAELLSDEDIRIVAEYFSGQTPSNTPSSVLDATDKRRARKLVKQGDSDRKIPACINCHQQDASGSDVFPRLAGQHPEYLVSQLQDFKTGKRSNDSSRQMHDISRQLTHQEIQIIAQYLAGLTPAPPSPGNE